MPDTSFNVQFSPYPPTFLYGAGSVGPFTIDVVDLTQPASLALHVRNEVGNEFDTILSYFPVHLSTCPYLYIGAWRNQTTIDSFVVITNLDSVNPVIIGNIRLKSDTRWKIVSMTYNLPDTLDRLASDTVWLQYTAPNNPQFEIDVDTLLVTTCREFAYTHCGRNKQGSGNNRRRL